MTEGLFFSKIFIGYFSARLSANDVKKFVRRVCPNVKQMVVLSKSGYRGALFCCASFQKEEHASDAMMVLSALRLRGKSLEVRKWHPRIVTNDRRAIVQGPIRKITVERRIRTSDRRRFGFFTIRKV